MLQQPPPSSPPPPSPRLALRLGKDVSVGEYDGATGLTFVTRQRGRLHFHMGVNAVRATSSLNTERFAATAAAEAAEAAEVTEATEATEAETAGGGDSTKAWAPSLRTGVFTGLALFAEEAFYLVQRGALAVWELRPADEGAPAGNEHPLDAAQFAGLLLRDQRASLPCLYVYAALKENQFYPRRHAAKTGGTPVGLAQPQHYAGNDGACPIAFDVWKVSTETVYVPNKDYADAAVAATAGEAAAPAAGPNNEEVAAGKRRGKKDRRMTKRKVKRLVLVFRVIVCRYADAAPPSACLLQAATAEHSDGESERTPPVKLAVVDEDRSVLFFEIGASDGNNEQLRVK